MAGKLYFCRHRWEGRACARCGLDEASTAGPGARPGAAGGRLPDWVPAPRGVACLEQLQQVAISTASFDPWASGPLGPSIVAATAEPSAGSQADRDEADD